MAAGAGPAEPQSQLSYVDFLEALARVAEMMRCPDVKRTSPLSIRVETIVNAVLYENRILLERDADDDVHIVKEKQRERELKLHEERQLERHHQAPDRGRQELVINGNK